MRTLQSSTLVTLLAIGICGGTQLLSAKAYQHTHSTLGDRVVPENSIPSQEATPHQTGSPGSDLDLASITY
ncbi:MAG: hypothetical protein AAFY57_12530 [Cyanobacteria bacterium J06642_2]